MESGRSNKLTLAIVNLPYRVEIDRRYNCTSYTPMFLFPPHELLQVATCAREWNGADVRFLDAIADRQDLQAVIAFLHETAPDVLVSIVGIESISDDLTTLDAIKQACPELTILVFGFYPTALTQGVLEKSRIDYILRGEPERPLCDYLAARSAGGDIESVPGLAGRRADGGIFVNPVERLNDLDALPLPDYGLVNVHDYEEGLLGGPCGAILSSRGCPYRCTYCTTTYGHRLRSKSAERIVEEMVHLIDSGVRLIRFMDDTFTVNQAHVKAICEILIERDIEVRWACLTRVDVLDPETLRLMKRAGCVRILVGIESYSKEVLEVLCKGAEPDHFNEQLLWIRDAGIQSVGFFLVGAPEETEADFQETLRGALSSPLDLVGVNIITPYPGTPYYEQVKEQVDFSLVPYECRFKDEQVGLTALRRERELYMRFYMRPSVILRQMRLVLRFPLRATKLVLMLLRYQTRRLRSHERPDLF